VATTASGELLLQSVDGFPALVDDPWLNARLTTLHACSDLWASGARVTSVQALVTVPEAEPRLQEELLVQSLSGVRSVLDPLQASLIGGHTLEGRDGAGLALALTVNGQVAPQQVWPKGPLQGGDLLLLSRPIGTGVLFAAALAGAAEASWLDGALALMQQSQAELVAILQAHGCRACTDITGFGLLGHLGEMVAADAPQPGSAWDAASPQAMPSPPSQDPNKPPAGPRAQAARGASAGVELYGAAIPALAGSLELLEQGHASSLAPSNAAALALLDGPIQLEAPLNAAQLALLVDPQTCGPLLAALPSEQAPAALAAMGPPASGRPPWLGGCWGPCLNRRGCPSIGPGPPPIRPEPGLSPARPGRQASRHRLPPAPLLHGGGSRSWGADPNGLRGRLEPMP
jgi:selenide,water dikinase